MNKGTVFSEGRGLGKRNWINCKRLGEDNRGDVRAAPSPAETLAGTSCT